MNRPRGFTLLETVLAIALFALLAGALYAIIQATIDATSVAMRSQADQERLDAFLRATRRAFVSSPANAQIFLRFETSAAAATPELVFRGGGTIFGIPGLGGGEVILAAPAAADGTRTFSLLRIPPAASEAELARAREPRNWLPLLPRVERVVWEFFSGGEWRAEWPEGAGRPQLVRLRFQQRDAGDERVEAVFWLPPLEARPAPGSQPRPVEP